MGGVAGSCSAGEPRGAVHGAYSRSKRVSSGPAYSGSTLRARLLWRDLAGAGERCASCKAGDVIAGKTADVIGGFMVRRLRVSWSDNARFGHPSPARRDRPSVV